MTDSAASTQTTTPKAASFWEDLIDIFYQPSDVFRRRERASAWPPFLFVVIALGIVTLATYPSIQPAFDGDYARTMSKMMAENKQMTQEMADKGHNMQAIGVQYFSSVFIAVAIVIVGFMTWLLGKFFGAIEGFSAAMLIASYAYIPRVIGAVASGLQGLLMDPTTLTSISRLSLSPARFMDPTTTSPIVMTVLSRLDLMIVWETVLLAIGIAVIGRISRGKAAAFGLLIWIVGSLSQLRSAFLMS